MTRPSPTMRRMGITHVVAIVLTWTSRRRAAAGRAAGDAAGGGRASGGRTACRSSRSAPIGWWRRRAADARLTVELARARPAPAPGTRERLGAIVFDHDNVPATTLTIEVAAVTAIVTRVRLGGRLFDQWPPALARHPRRPGAGTRHGARDRALPAGVARAHAEGLMRAAFGGDGAPAPRTRRLRGAGARPPRPPDEAGRPGPRVIACGERALVRILAHAPRRGLRVPASMARSSCSRCRRLRSRRARSPTRSRGSLSPRARSTPTT